MQENEQEMRSLISSCEKEQLHLSGTIQPHGVVFGVEADTMRVTHVSENSDLLLGIGPEATLGKQFSELFPTIRLGQTTSLGSLQFLPLSATVGGRSYDAIVSTGENHHLVEFEPSEGDGGPIRAQLRLIHTQPPRDEGEMGEFFHKTANQVRAATGYDRVMVYRFLDDGSGEVVGESLADDVTGYMGLRFPASDIPHIARRLYTLTGHRHIPNVEVEPVRLLSVGDATQSLDQSYGQLRSVSPLHIQYLKNMGVASSFSVAIEIRGKLWGLIACHHRKPLYLPYELRSQCHQLGRGFGLGVLSCQSSTRLRFIDDIERSIDLIGENILGAGTGLGEALTSEADAILALTRSTGCALVGTEGIFRWGDTPDIYGITNIDAWFQQRNEDFLHTDNLTSIWESGRSMEAHASGAIMTRVARRNAAAPWRFYWFRPEQVREVHWAGDPRKNPGNEDAQILNPRESFSRWVEVRRGYSSPWTAADLMAAKKFRTVILRWY